MTGFYEFKRWTEDWWKTPKGHWCASGSDWTKNSVFLSCPVCGDVARLPHAVDVQGKVSPSVVCPHVTCPMHLAPVTLAGWDLGTKPPDP